MREYSWLTRKGFDYFLDDQETFCVTTKAKKTNMEYAYTHDLTGFFAEKGLLQRLPKEGRKKMFCYTEKGKQIQELIQKIKEEENGL